LNFISNSEEFGEDHKTIIDEKAPSNMRKCTGIALLLEKEVKETSNSKELKGTTKNREEG
jgi:hypothetical protein